MLLEDVMTDFLVLCLLVGHLNNKRIANIPGGMGPGVVPRSPKKAELARAHCRCLDKFKIERDRSENLTYVVHRQELY